MRGLIPVGRLIVACLLSTIPSVAANAQDKRVEVPDAAAQKGAEKLIREVFKDDYSKKSPEDKRVLARKLLDQAAQTKEDIASRFVLLREARDLSAAIGDVELGLRAVDAIAISFEINAPEMKLSLLAIAEKNVRTPEDSRALAGYYLRLANLAIQGENFDNAEKVISAAGQAARRTKDISLMTRIDAKSKEISSLKARFEKVRKAQDVLQKSPEDPSSNLEVGTWLCLIRENWEEGLAFLGRGPDSALKGVASRELTKPADPTDQLDLADTWWELAAKEGAGSKESMQKRAGFWYRKAAPALTGLNKTRANKRLLEIFSEPGKKGAWIEVPDPASFGHPGKSGDAIELDGPSVGGKSVELVKWPAGEFDGVSVRIRFKGAKLAFAILRHGPGCELSLLPYQWSAIQMDKNNSPLARSQGKFEDTKELVVTILVAESEFIYHIDGVEVGRLKAPIVKLETLRLNALGGIVVFDRIKLRKRE